MTQLSMQNNSRSEISSALLSCKLAFAGVAIFSGMINVLMLTGAFFMLQVYDRVLTSGSVPTLVALALLAAFLFMMMGVLDLIRGRMLVRIGASLDEDLGGRAFDTLVKIPLKTGNKGEGLQPLRDLDAIRSFLSGPGPTAFFDMPWMPVYLAIIFAFHTLLGVTAIIGALVLVTMTIATHFLTRKPTADATQYAQSRNGLAEAGRRNAEAVAAMGMAGRLGQQWRSANQSYMSHQRKVTDVTTGFGAISRALRMLLQSTMLGMGAYLVINQQATPGIIIAGSILVGRALAPIDLAIAQWRGFTSARQSWQRLNKMLDKMPEVEEPMALPAPENVLSVEGLGGVPPGEQNPVFLDVEFKLHAGHALGIIGTSASGKSSLARVLVGAWAPARGKVCLDGAALDQWSNEALGHHIGYLPQSVELFAGTVAQNIARFDPEVKSDDIIEAAKEAGTHELITNLPNGYETEIGEQGHALSAGQRQRVALARALYGKPFLVVLDEPNSNLDNEGEAALAQSIMRVRNRKGVVVLIAHRPSVLAAVDFVLIMNQGRASDIGPKDEVLGRLNRANVNQHNANQSSNKPLKNMSTGIETHKKVIPLRMGGKVTGQMK